MDRVIFYLPPFWTKKPKSIKVVFLKDIYGLFVYNTVYFILLLINFLKVSLKMRPRYRISVHLYTSISRNPGANTTIYVPKNSF